MSARPLRVLLVEDSEEDAMLMLRALERGGFAPSSRRVETAGDLLHALREETWDVVLADYNMPHLTGIEAFEVVRSTGADIPFIIVSGAISDQTAVEAMRLGVDDYLFKGNLARLPPAIERETRERDQRRLLETQVREAQKMEAVGRLAGGVAHDFNNLLSVILSYASVLVDGVTDPEQRHAAEQIERAADRAAALTRRLLTISRRQPVDLRVVPPNELITDMMDMVRRVIGEDVRLSVELDEHVHNVRVDPGQFGQVLLNLIVNARDAMPGGGDLRITTSEVVVDARNTRTLGLPAGGYVAIAVADSGVGMPPEVVQRLFEPFFTTKAPHKGTGLGLATSYGIIAQVGGAIRVATAPGQGSTFTIYVPVAGEPVAEPVPAPAPAVGRAGATLLLVEDEREVAEVEARTLRDAGYRVLVAESAEQGMDLARTTEGPIDLLVTDMVLPGATGRDLAAWIAQLRPGTKVLFVSGYPGDNGLEAVDVLQKPFTRHTLLDRVQRALSEPRRAAEPVGAPKRKAGNG